MKIVIRVVIVALVIMGLPKFIPDIAVSSFYYALIAAVAFGLVNLLIKPLISLVTLPVNMLTLGLFGLVINGGLLWAVAYYLPGFGIATYGAAFLGALAVTVASWLASKI